MRLALALLALPLLVADAALIAASDFGSPQLVTDFGVVFPKHREPLDRRPHADRAHMAARLRSRLGERRVSHC